VVEPLNEERERLDTVDWMTTTEDVADPLAGVRVSAETVDVTVAPEDAPVGVTRPPEEVAEPLSEV